MESKPLWLVHYVPAVLINLLKGHRACITKKIGIIL